MSSNLSVNVTASATGNPRNKTALKPGFSLVGWIRLSNSGEDLTGLKGKILPVSHEELMKHNTFDDLWMAIRGCVYNITRYVDYHPGGRDQLLRGAGKDATSLFDEYHAWVNIEKLLAKCYVGPLRNTVTLNLNEPSPKMDKLSPFSMSSSSSSSNMVKLHGKILSLSSESLTKTVQSPEAIQSPQIEVIPRFDWIQKTSNLSIFFYTKNFCNPGISVEFICDKESLIKIFIGKTTNSYKFNFLKPLKWPCTATINQETGKIEMTFQKQFPELWPNFGIFERTRSKDEVIFSEYCIVSRNFFNHDSFELVLRNQKEQVSIFPVGSHLNFKLSDDGQDGIIRSYTPIPLKLCAMKDTMKPSDALFLIKAYGAGTFSKLLSETLSDVLVSQPKIKFDLNIFKSHRKFGLIAAGSGITPILSMLIYFLEREIDIIKIFCFNKTEADIWLRKELDDLAKKDSRLSIKHILSACSTNINSSKESNHRMVKVVDEIISSSITFAFVCGPLRFNDAAVQLLKDRKIEYFSFD